jgi:putative SOS response-associated peptidase YedK
LLLIANYLKYKAARSRIILIQLNYVRTLHSPNADGRADKRLSSRFRTERSFTPRFNVAPTQDIPVIRSTEAGRELTWMRWGFIPAWSKDANSGPLLINARAETAAEKSAFRSAFKSRRCLIPADGFFEWKRAGNKKQPYHLRRADDRPFAFAGLWETWQAIESCTILTTDANELIKPLHDRMPVILSPNDYADWLNPNANEPDKLLTAFPASQMSAILVNPIVNNARNEGPECIEPIANT